MNKIYLIGNLCHTPELRTTPAGKEVCNMSIAVNRRARGKDGEQQADFFNLQAWDKLATTCANYLTKGRKIAVVGEMHSRQYDAKDGTKKTAWEVLVNEVEFLGPKDETGEKAAPAAPKPKTAQPAGYTVADDEPFPF